MRCPNPCFAFAALLLLLLQPQNTLAQVQFADVTAAKGLASFTSSPGDGHGPGAVFTDLNGDGYADIYMMRAGNNSNGLYVNQENAGGLRTFVRANYDAGLGDMSSSNGAIAGDYDNDGDLDMFVINWNQPNKLYRNNLVGTGQFIYTDVTAQTDPTASATDSQQGLAGSTHAGVALDNSLTAAWGDPDRDGDLDLYVGTHHEYFGSPGLQPGEIPGQRDTFYRNNGNGTFTDITMELGVPGFETSSGEYSTLVQDYSSTNAVIFADFNNDQWPDLLVTNKVGGPHDREMLYINQGADAEGEWLGYETITYQMPRAFGNRSGGAMGVDVADLDHDGDLDFYITDWSNRDLFPNGGSNDLWINQLSETGSLEFVHSTELPALYSWGTQIADFDNNGYEDVHVATDTGAADFLYLNSAEGFTADVAEAAGVAQSKNSRGDVTADFNRDGLLDLLVINPWSGPSALYENRTENANHFLSLKLEGDPDLPGEFRSSRDAIGARVYVSADLDGDGTIETGERMIREVVSGSSNAASTSSLELEFGLGLADTAEIEILWPSGRKTVFDATADQFLSVKELLGEPADLNMDGFVDGLDLGILLGNFEQNAAASAGELNGSDPVDGLDLGILLGAWNPPPAGAEAATVPESATFLLLCLAIILSSVRRPRRFFAEERSFRVT